jgi:hypothetical protein
MMLPTPDELREESNLYRAAARQTANVELKHRLASCASALARIAEDIEGDREAEAKRAYYERVLSEARRPVDLTTAPRSAAEVLRSINAWRRRAEELRTTADSFVVPSAQDSLRRAAANYDKMADDAEARLAPRRPERGETAC